MNDHTPQLPLFTIVSGDLPPIIQLPNNRITDLSGRKFGRLLVLGYIGRDTSNRLRWLCRCDCGNFHQITGIHLTAKGTQSCGCLAKETSSAIATTHGMTGTPEYRTWRGILARCLRTTNRSYARYGGRGIDVCERWQQSFEAFFEDMGPKPGSGYSIDRIDNNLGYSPENCRWATAIEQANNKRDNRVITYQGKSLTVAEWARETGISSNILSDRLRSGWSAEEILTRPAQEPRPCRYDELIEFSGERLTIFGWAEKTGIPYKTLRSRQKQHWPIEKMLTTPVRKRRRA